jgi:hypothetical protein
VSRAPRAGQVVTIPEEHYLYGTGDLTLRLARVGELVPGQEWVAVRGVEIRWDGRDGPRREVLVRVAALPRIAADTTGRPQR